MDYIELTLKLTPRDPWSEILMTELADLGYESFVETDEGILAYAKVQDVDVEHPCKGSSVELTNKAFQAEIDVKIIPQQNWNAVWESDFHPVFVEDQLTILAPFHDPSEAKGMVVWIEPKMSFGTGHHQTTWMMSKVLLDLPMKPNRILDMGTGTGVLAIIAEKLGARDIVAVDIEDWSVENTRENAQRNNCVHIEAVCGDIDVLEEQHFDLILANINKNVLKRHMSSYAKMLDADGVLVMSGFFETDIDELVLVASQNGLIPDGQILKESWAALTFKKMNR
jgi:ribosomal protein L11 methyltransferase